MYFVMEREITYDDVLLFIIKNKEKVEIMDDLNKTVYPFTSRYRNREKKKVEPHHGYFFWDTPDNLMDLEDEQRFTS